MIFADTWIFMRGGGDLATGAAIRLVRAGFPLVIAELPRPLAVRRTVSFASAVLEGEWEVEGIKAQRVESAEAAQTLAANGGVPVLVDPKGLALRALRPRVLIDARLKKKNIDTGLGDAPLVVGLGPGFAARQNCDAVVETKRGHFLGRVYWEGHAEADTGTPDRIGDQEALRVLRAPHAGLVRAHAAIGEMVTHGQFVASVGNLSVLAPFDGVLRGLIADGTKVNAGMKIGDVDPRGKRIHCFTVSDKSLAVGGGVLEAVLRWMNTKL